MFKFLFTTFFVVSFVTSNAQKLIFSGSGTKSIYTIDKQSKKIIREIPLEQKAECNNLSVDEVGNIYYSAKYAAVKVDLEGRKTILYTAVAKEEVQSVQYDKGTILIGVCGNPAKIIEIPPNGKQTVTKVNLGIAKPHSQFRTVIKAKNGNFLLPCLAKKSVIEIDYKGDVLKETFLNTKKGPFSIIELENNNWLLSLGDLHELWEFNPKTKEVVWKIKENDLGSVALQYVAKCRQLSNGNFLLCNWGGHAHKKGKPKVAQIVEFSKNKEIRWKLNDWKRFGNVSTVFEH